MTRSLNVTLNTTEQHLIVRSGKLEASVSVAAGFGRHGMSPPAANDTGTALGQDGSGWSRNLATLTFNLRGHAGRRTPSVYQV